MYTGESGFSWSYFIILDFLWLLFWVSPSLQVQIVVGILFWCLEEKRENSKHYKNGQTPQKCVYMLKRILKLDIASTYT